MEERVPEIRFKEFEGQWEKNIFEEVVKRLSELSTDASLPRVEYEDIVSGIGTINKDLYQKNSHKSGIIFHKGDVLYGKLRPYLQNWLLAFFDGIAVGDFWVLQPQGIDSGFLYRLIQGRKFSDTANQSTGTKMPRADWKLVSKTAFFIPQNVNEQFVIGDFFINLDSLIISSEQKLGQLKIFKKACLEKMFPKEGEAVPEIRFKGFEGPWQKKTFGSIVEKYVDPVATPKNGYYRLGIKSHAKGTFHSYVEKGQELETAQMHRVAKEKFIVNITFAWEHAVAITTESDEGKLVSHRFPQFSFHNDMFPDFFRYVISNEKFRHHLWLSSPGGAGRNRVLKIEEMLAYNMIIPSKEEQKQIAEYLGRIDNLIDLTQQKLDKLKNLKKALLDRMFV